VAAVAVLHSVFYSCRPLSLLAVCFDMRIKR
jgi:hypothetical protein